MKKIFSLALMATALLISGQAKAAGESKAKVKIGETEISYSTLQSAFEAVLTNDVEAEITMLDDADLNCIVTLTKNQKVVWNLNGKTITCTNSRFYVDHAKLVVTNGDAAENGNITNSGNLMFTAYGSQNPADSAYTVITIEQNVNIEVSNTYATGIMNWTRKQTIGKGLFEYVIDDAKVSKHAYGVIFNIAGFITSKDPCAYITGNSQDIPGVNGVPQNAFIPVYNISSTATLISTGTSGETAGIYAAGYGIWNIEGAYIQGLCGIYAKSGELNLNNTTVKAVADVQPGQYQTPQPNNNGFTGGAGTAIVLDSKNGYAGKMEMTISGNSTITGAENAYALDELKTDAQVSKTDAVVISGGIVNGSINTTTEVKDDCKLNGTITGGTFTDETIKDYIGNVNGVIEVQEGEETKYVVNGMQKGKDWVTTIAAAKDTDFVKIAADEEVASDKEIAYLNIPGANKVTVRKGAKLAVGEAVLGEEAVIEVEAGGKLIINGTNGLIAFLPENIVLKADSASRAVFVLNPNVKANKSPYATVEYYSNARAMAKGYRWDIFACPFAHVDSLKNNLKAEDIYPGKSKGSAYQYWGGTQWVSCSTKQQLLDNITAFTPIAITNTCAKGKHCTYTFYGQLQGNISGEFALETGYNYFGNGFMGAMDAQKMMTALKNQSQKVNAVIYIWNSQDQRFVDYQENNISSMADLKGMDFFILKATADANVTLDYTTLVWDKNK